MEWASCGTGGGCGMEGRGGGRKSRTGIAQSERAAEDGDQSAVQNVKGVTKKNPGQLSRGAEGQTSRAAISLRTRGASLKKAEKGGRSRPLILSIFQERSGVVLSSICLTLQPRRRSAFRLFFEIGISERLPIVIAHQPVCGKGGAARTAAPRCLSPSHSPRQKFPTKRGNGSVTRSRAMEECSRAKVANTERTAFMLSKASSRSNRRLGRGSTPRPAHPTQMRP